MRTCGAGRIGQRRPRQTDGPDSRKTPPLRVVPAPHFSVKLYLHRGAKIIAGAGGSRGQLGYRPGIILDGELAAERLTGSLLPQASLCHPSQPPIPKVSIVILPKLARMPSTHPVRMPFNLLLARPGRIFLVTTTLRFSIRNRFFSRNHKRWMKRIIIGN